MVSNSDLQLWQAAVKGINESGQTELTQDEWSALAVLNNSLSSVDFSSEESRLSYQMLNNNLSRHGNNPVLHKYLNMPAYVIALVVGALAGVLLLRKNQNGAMFYTLQGMVLYNLKSTVNGFIADDIGFFVSDKIEVIFKNLIIYQRLSETK
jgi:hypothetical protein